jgi:hypothetical protein
MITLSSSQLIGKLGGRKNLTNIMENPCVFWNSLENKHSVILRNSSEYCIFKYNKISWSILISYFVPMNIPRYIDILEPVCRIS